MEEHYPKAFSKIAHGGCRGLHRLPSTLSLQLKNVNLLSFSYSYSYPSVRDPSKTDIFEYADLVQLIAAIFCVAYSLLSSKIKKEGSNPIPLMEIITLGTLYTLNVNTLNYSLYYIPYPVRVVGDKLGYLTAVVVAVYFTRIKKNKKVSLGP